MDALARQYAATHDPKILAELKELSRRLGELKNKTTATSPKILH
jgi:DNA-binding HxlR family transcriptional regulator